MIELPTRKKLEGRRDKLYAHLIKILHIASVHQVEDIMRRIHLLNLRLRTYFPNTDQKPKKIEDATQDTDTFEDTPSEQDLAEIEEEFKADKL